ncbi:HEPN domain-containing protein [Chitinophaga sp. YIM B06452]|uniref:HEPN domain-containing protein n=1 Tax=Chitinophaga sp. YIM B06452 TaxID=3082158 RepID=UPI0031FE9F5B
MARNESAIKKIDGRDWAVQLQKWAQYIPSIDKAGEPPAYELSKFGGLSEIYAKVDESQGSYSEDIPVLRSEVLREAIYLIHKGIHVSGAAFLHLESGVTSWALSNAYQSSFFLLKGILAALGLSFPRLSKILLIDCFPKEEELSRSAIKKGRSPKVEIKFQIFNELSHVEYWEILQRVLRVSTIGSWPEEFVSYIIKIKADQFVHERNNLHYKNHYWTFPADLFERLVDPAFGVNNRFLTDYEVIMDSSEHQYSFFINYSLLYMGLILIKDISELSKDIQEEYHLMIKTIKSGSHNRLLESIGSSPILS